MAENIYVVPLVPLAPPKCLTLRKGKFIQHYTIIKKALCSSDHFQHLSILGKWLCSQFPQLTRTPKTFCLMRNLVLHSYILVIYRLSHLCHILHIFGVITVNLIQGLLILLFRCFNVVFTLLHFVL